jgi:hypothetical protein
MIYDQRIPYISRPDFDLACLAISFSLQTLDSIQIWTQVHMPVAFGIARPRSVCPVSLQLKNVAAVMVPPTLPVFAQVGQ